MSIRVADKVMELLAAKGVHAVFTVTGGGAIFLDDALGKCRDLKYYCCHHEQAAAMAAEGYARVSGDVGVTLVTTGPGGTNAITGVGCSWMDSVPHLFISGQVFRSQMIRDSGTRQIGVQEINIVDLVRPITKYAVTVETPESTLLHVEKAMHLARLGRPGPVWVDIPADIQNAIVEDSAFTRFKSEEIPAESWDADLEAKVAEVAARLQRAKRPLIHIGQGIRIGNAVDEFFQLAERHQIPFVTARNANELTDWDHPLYVGRPGTFPNRGANFAVQNADVYLAIGTRLALTQTGYNSHDFARAAFRIMVDVDRAELNKPTLKLDLKVHSEAKRFLELLLQRLFGTPLDTRAWISRCQKWKADFPAVPPECREQEHWLNSYVFVDVLSEVLGRDDVIVTDMGLAFQATHQALRVKRGQRFFTNGGFAPMGWGLPAAIGACLAHQKRRVVCIAGDGGLQMNLQELATVMHHRLPVKLFVFNNGGYLTIKQSQELAFSGRVMGCNPETGLGFPDLEPLAKAYRMEFLRIDSKVNLEKRLRKIMESPGPVICELMQDPDQPQIPKAIPRRNAEGKALPTAFEDLYPFLPPEEVKANCPPAK